MRAREMAHTFSFLLCLAGCTSAHEPVAVESGLYDLTISGERDACSPARATGAMGIVAVVSADDVLSVAVPDLTGEAMRVSLSRSSGFHVELSEDVPTCTGATLLRAYTAVARAGGGFDVLYREDWSGLSTCGTAMHSIVPAAPSADCRADLVLGYRLDATCAAPCELRVGTDGTAACACR